MSDTGPSLAVLYRAADLSALSAALTEEISLLDAREADTARAIRSAAAECAAALKRREDELLATLHDDCALQREAFACARSDVDARAEELRAAMDCDPSAEGLSADVDALLRASAYFDVPEVRRYTVAAVELRAERHLALLRTSAAAEVPPALTVPATAHVPLRALEKLLLLEEEGKEKKKAEGSEEVPRGIMYYIGSAGHKRPFRNPIDAGAVRVRCSAPLVAGRLAELFGAADAKSQCVRTASAEGARVEVDFGERRWVDCEAYAIRHGSAETHVALRSWRLLASRDGAEWEVIDEQKRNRALGSAPFNVATFVIDREKVFARKGEGRQDGPGETGAFRYFALELAGPDAIGEHHIEISGLEFYGSLIDASTL